MRRRHVLQAGSALALALPLRVAARTDAQRELRRLLAEKPRAVVGLAVPAMPIGSPGMDGPEYGARRDPYDVLLVRKDGSSTTYQSYHR